MENKRKEDFENEMQELLKYISENKKIQNDFHNEYKELAKDFVPISYRKKTFLDIIFPKRYRKFEEDYKKSEEINNKLKELDRNIYLIQVEIERLEDYLYELQHNFSKMDLRDDNNNTKNINEDDKEPYNND